MSPDQLLERIAAFPCGYFHSVMRETEAYSILNQLIDNLDVIALNDRVPCASVHVKQNRIRIIERRDVLRPAA